MLNKYRGRKYSGPKVTDGPVTWLWPTYPFGLGKERRVDNWSIIVQKR